MLTVYSKENCTYCVQAKALLESKGIAYNEVRIDKDMEALAFIKAKGHRTVPQIYKGDKLFVDGGFSGLVKYFEEQNAIQC